MATNDVEQLKNYYHTSLQSLRKYPFYTDDYEDQLEAFFEKRLTEITDMILILTKKQMDLVHDFKEVFAIKLIFAFLGYTVKIHNPLGLPKILTGLPMVIKRRQCR